MARQAAYTRLMRGSARKRYVYVRAYTGRRLLRGRTRCTELNPPFVHACGATRGCRSGLENFETFACKFPERGTTIAPRNYFGNEVLCRPGRVIRTVYENNCASELQFARNNFAPRRDNAFDSPRTRYQLIL